MLFALLTYSAGVRFMGLVHFLQAVVTLNGSFQWPVVWHYLFEQAFWRGAILTIILAVISQLVGTLIGLLLYFVRHARVWPVRAVGGFYVWIFRGTPLLVQIFVFDQLVAYLHLTKALRAINFFTPLGFPNFLMDAFVAAFVALALNEGAYMAEIIRAGIDAIDVGQIEAAKSLGMTYSQAMRRIVLPQAMRVIVPPLGNEFNNMLKNTSLAAEIGVFELLKVAITGGATTFDILEFLVIASLYYLLLTTLWGLAQTRIERYFSASSREPGTIDTGSWLTRAFGFGSAGKLRVPPTEVAAGVPAEH